VRFSVKPAIPIIHAVKAICVEMISFTVVDTIKLAGCQPCCMPRKVGTSFVVTQEQMSWLEEQDESMSQVVRNALEEYREDRE